MPDVRQGHELTQAETILAALKRGERLTQLDALTRYGVGRLAARVHDLRRQGYDVRCRLTKVEARHGGARRVAQYTLGRRER